MFAEMQAVQSPRRDLAASTSVGDKLHSLNFPRDIGYQYFIGRMPSSTMKVSNFLSSVQLYFGLPIGQISKCVG